MPRDGVEVNALLAWFARVEEVMAFKAIRQGLILTIPVLLIGSFSLIFLNLPLPGYQEFLAATPWFKNLFDVSYAATLGIFSLYVAVAISLRYAHAYAGRFGDFFTQGAPFAALAAAAGWLSRRRRRSSR